MKRYLGPVTLALLLACTALLGTVAAAADTPRGEEAGAIVLERPGDTTDICEDTPFRFAEPFGPEATCSGACDCSSCVCIGSGSCCDAGCDACWDYRDDNGLCGPVAQ
jgi:hypothetical protein